MLNLIRCVAICLAVLFLSACTTIDAKRGFAVKTWGYEFTCAHEPSQTVIDGDVVKKLTDAAKALLPAAKLDGADVPKSEIQNLADEVGKLTTALNKKVPTINTLVTACSDLAEHKSRWWH